MPDLGLPDLATLDSRALGSRILVVRGDGVPIPSDLAALPIYTWSELAAIVDGGLVCTHPRGEVCQCRRDLRQIHALKQRFGGTVEGRGEVEVAASRKAAEQFRAMHVEAVAAIAKAREEGAAVPTLLPLGVPGGEWCEALHERIEGMLAEVNADGLRIPLVATQILRAVDDALQAQRAGKGASS
jgi:hypothetical protein